MSEDGSTAVEKKRGGRQKAAEKAVPEKDEGVKETKKRGRPAAAEKKEVKKAVAADSDGEAPVKRGRGRPPKGTKASAKKDTKPKAAAKGKSRGRPAKKVEKSDDDEGEENDTEENGEEEEGDE